MERIENPVIPNMTHPLSRAWHQPSRKNITIDETHALMTEKTFKELLEYSTSQPSGVYEGKMWKSRTRNGQWFLCWFGVSEKLAFCSNNNRSILVV